MRAYATNLYTGQETETRILLIDEHTCQFIIDSAKRLRPILGQHPDLDAIDLHLENSPMVETFTLDVDGQHIDDNLYHQLDQLAFGNTRSLYIQWPEENRPQMSGWYTYRRNSTSVIVNRSGVWLRIGSGPVVEFCIHRWHEDTQP